MLTNKFPVHSQLRSNSPYLIFKKLSERLYKLKLQLAGQSPHVVVRFNGRGRAFDRIAFNHIRINGALGQELRFSYFISFFFKNADKPLPDDFSLPLRGYHFLKSFKKQSGSVNADDVKGQLTPEFFHQFLVLPFSQKPVINKYAEKIILYSLMDDQRRDQRIDSTAEPADNFLPIYKLPDFLHFLGHERTHSPFRL